MDYLKFEEWKTPHAVQMQDLTYARPDDFFIYTRVKFSCEVEGKQVVYAETIDETIGYLRHVFLYDILNDATDDLELDFKYPFSQRQTDAISLLNHWFKLGKIATADDKELLFYDFCKNFNAEFNQKSDTEYEIAVLNGANELKRFLTKKYKNHKNFDKKRLDTFCNDDLFSGKLLKDFLNDFFISTQL